MREQPGEMLDPSAPPGTPIQKQVAASAHPVWCAHGVRWKPTAAGWAADDVTITGHEKTAAECGAIPCQPTYASHEAWVVLAEAREAGLE